ncbi:MAG: PEP-CTERM sorting domain-containing protein [Cyanobacteria bacterium Co-bin13]|nr:PEP-CTERM sorting domain-containing protein [Cyanobacteria bacterium Co-bin13]
MKHIALAAVAALGLSAVAAPANAAVFAWNIEYTGWWEEEGGGSLLGTISAREEDAADGIVSFDELLSWVWDWTGNTVMPAFSISSAEGGVTDFNPSFYIDGRTNLPLLDGVDQDGLDQGVFESATGDRALDLNALFVTSFDENLVESLSTGDATAALGTVAVSDPTPVPEPATVLGLVALVGVGAATLQRQKQAA